MREMTSPTQAMTPQKEELPAGGASIRSLIAALIGLKIGRAFAWRTLVAAELVFGASGGDGGA